MEQLQEILQGVNGYMACAVIAFIALDVISGIAKGAAQGNISSKIMKRGFWHKSAFILALALAGLVDFVTNLGGNIGVNGLIFKSVATYLCTMETVSIVENITEINPELKGSKVLGLFGKHEKDEVQDFVNTQDKMDVPDVAEITEDEG